MPYRTKTYIAAEWDGDSDLIETLRRWDRSEYWSLHFLDAHDLCSSRDSSLNCTIKNSLYKRLARSKTFILIVGDKTASVTAGSCSHCYAYSKRYRCCNKSGRIDMRSYIKFECEYAANNVDEIIVIYNSTKVDKYKCPKALQNKGLHIPAIVKASNGGLCWNYHAIKRAIGNG